MLQKAMEASPRDPGASSVEGKPNIVVEKARGEKPALLALLYSLLGSQSAHTHSSRTDSGITGVKNGAKKAAGNKWTDKK
mmetsp:Transcript_28850/g.47713  ORF Transcript_28850/g.47713 Transcript_28850/m.47713 type:complete len:80 (-) Transcript_28850:28-267(-)